MHKKKLKKEMRNEEQTNKLYHTTFEQHSIISTQNRQSVIRTRKFIALSPPQQKHTYILF